MRYSISMESLKIALDRTNQVLATALDKFFEDSKTEIERLPTISQELWSHLEKYLRQKGKGLRPLMIALGYAVGTAGTLEEALANPDVQKGMVLIELTHKRFLITDDIADRDEMRHGKPSFHLQLEKKWGSHLARSTAEAAAFWLQQRIAKLDSAQLMPKLYDETIAGWLMGFNQLQQPISHIAPEDIKEALRLVTAPYSISIPLQIGRHIARAAVELDNSFEEYGNALGLLFQLTDDRIGLYGDPEKTGKPVGNDLREGKKTLYVSYVWQKANPTDRTRLESMLGRAELVDVEWFHNLVKALQVDKQFEAELQALAQTAHNAVDSMPPGPSLATLHETIDFIHNRSA